MTINPDRRAQWLRKRFEKHSEAVRRIVAQLSDSELLALELEHTVRQAAAAVKPEKEPEFSHKVELIVTKAMREESWKRNVKTRNFRTN